MITEDYASYEMAKKLKKAGFDWPCEHYYTIEDCIDGQVWLTSGICQNYNEAPELSCVKCSAPLLSQAQKWLREVLLLHIGVNPAIPTLKWQFYIDDLNQQVNPHDGELMARWDEDMQDKVNEQMYDSYEAALSAGIAAALELIKKGGSK